MQGRWKRWLWSPEPCDIRLTMQPPTSAFSITTSVGRQAKYKVVLLFQPGPSFLQASSRELFGLGRSHRSAVALTVRLHSCKEWNYCLWYSGKESRKHIW